MSSQGEMVRLKRGDFLCILTISTHSYFRAPSKTYTYYCFGRVRGVSDGLATSYFDWDETPRKLADVRPRRTWGVPASEIDAERFWQAVKERGDQPFETFEAAQAFAKQFKRSS